MEETKKEVTLTVKGIKGDKGKDGIDGKNGIDGKDVDTTSILSSISTLEKAIKEKQFNTKDTEIIKELIESKSDNSDVVEAINSLAELLKTKPEEKVEIDYTVKFNELMDTIVSSNQLRPGYNPSVPQIRNVAGETINPSTEEKQDAIIFYHENHICTDNTTTTPLGANAVFTGAWQDCLQYQEVNVSISTDKNSATDGLEIQWSDNGTDIADKDNFTVYANVGTNYTPNPAFRYVRLKYTNGSVAQGSFHLMTILRRGMTGGSFHRITDTLKDDSDGRLNLSVLKLRTAANNYVSGSATNSGNFKVSIEEYEAGSNPIRTDLEGGGSVTIGTTAVELTFTGTTRNIILTANQSNTGIIYIGKSTVTNLGANAITFLMPGESLSLDYNDSTNALYAVSDTAAQSLFKGTLL